MRFEHGVAWDLNPISKQSTMPHRTSDILAAIVEKDDGPVNGWVVSKSQPKLEGLIVGRNSMVSCVLSAKMGV